MCSIIRILSSKIINEQIRFYEATAVPIPRYGSEILN
jgi:hypothetical protein